MHSETVNNWTRRPRFTPSEQHANYTRSNNVRHSEIGEIRSGFIFLNASIGEFCREILGTEMSLVVLARHWSIEELLNGENDSRELDRSS